MAYDITTTLTRVNDFVPSKKVLVTDATATTTTQGDLGSASFRHFRAYVALSTFTEADGNAVASSGLAVSLEASTSSNFDAANTAVYTLDSKYFPTQLTAASVKPCFQLQGTVPVLTPQRYVRIVIAAGTNGAVNYDAIIEAA
jgi:hypothetical protein